MEEIIVTPQPSGDILLETTFLSEDGSCRKLSDMASKTSIPGRFTFYVEKYGTTNVFQVLDMKADEYVIAYFIVSDEEDRNYTISRLMTRKKEAKAEVIEKFKTITEEQGIKSENTAILSKFGTSAIYKYIIYTIQIMQRKQVHIHKVLRVQK
uniref:Lipocalin/cytosolic fatty-acid binding domain-containing protein n=1 Tax=Astyanax mexicanus TaxID=7994 RepID=A0A8B9GT84_ASTMX